MEDTVKVRILPLFYR